MTTTTKIYDFAGRMKDEEFKNIQTYLRLGDDFGGGVPLDFARFSTPDRTKIGGFDILGIPEKPTGFRGKMFAIETIVNTESVATQLPGKEFRRLEALVYDYQEEHLSQDILNLKELVTEDAKTTILGTNAENWVWLVRIPPSIHYINKAGVAVGYTIYTERLLVKNE